MGRCISVDPLGFRNFKLGLDSHICKYDDSKADNDNVRCFTHLQERVSYWFVNNGIGNPKQSLLSYWARRILKSEIMKKGTEHDKAYLSGNGNVAYQSRKKSSRKRKNATHVLYPHRQARTWNPVVNSLTTAQILNEREDQEMRVNRPRGPFVNI
jgi:hypothetical protein